MPATKQKITLTENFRKQVQKTGLTHSALAKAMGITPQFFSAVWNGKESVTARFMYGAITSGLAKSFDEVAQPVTPEKEAA